MINNISILQENECYGCSSCVYSCPFHAINLVVNEEGFRYPVVNSSLCTNCGICLKKCPFTSNLQVKDSEKNLFAAKSNDSKNLKRSSSGGIFYEIARFFLKNGGHISGCIMNDEMTAEHVITNDVSVVIKMQGSKYVQSDINNIYVKVKDKLIDGVKVLFTGTPCQVAGLNAFLGKAYSNLVTIDFICHGVPSPLFFNKYIEYLSKNIHAEVNNYKFRYKKNSHWEIKYFMFASRKRMYIRQTENDPYFRAFKDASTYRYCCYTCKYSNPSRVSDITIGDFWGIHCLHPEFKYSKGASFVLTNTKKGRYVFDKLTCEKRIFSMPSNFNLAAKFNGNVLRPTVIPGIREKIYEDINQKDLIQFFNKYKPNTKQKLIIILKYLIPYNIRMYISSIIYRLNRKDTQ